MWYIYTMEYYAAIKRNEVLPFAMMWMELKGGYYAERNKSIRERQI